MFNSAFITALDALCAQHNVARSIKDGKITLIDSGNQESQGRTILRLAGPYYGLTEDDYGATITSKGKTFKLVGINTNAPRYPLQMENQADGAVWRFPRSIVPQIVAQRQSKPTAATQAPAPSQVTQTPQPAPANHSMDAFAQF